MTNSSAGAPDQEPVFIEVGNDAGRRRIAVRARSGAGPGLFWLSGFHSDMRGTKAIALDAWAAEPEQPGRAAAAGADRDAAPSGIVADLDEYRFLIRRPCRGICHGIVYLRGRVLVECGRSVNGPLLGGRGA